jgi:hypothetical protein
MFADPNTQCPIATRGPALEPAFNFQWGWSSGTVLSGSLQKVTIDRVLRLLEAVGLEASLRVRRAA